MSLMARVDHARSGLQAANDRLSAARGVGKPKEPEEKGFFGKMIDKAKNASLSDIVHTGLDVAGFIPGVGTVADLANAGLYLAEGDKVNAALSATAAVPLVGDAAAAAKLGVKATNAALDTARVADNAAGAAKGADAPTPSTSGGSGGGGDGSSGGGSGGGRPNEEWNGQHGPVEEGAHRAADYADANGGAAHPDYVGNRPYGNDGRNPNDMILPERNANGDPITYREYDVNPYQTGVNRGGERIVIGAEADGSKSYYSTRDHYRSFVKFR